MRHYPPSRNILSYDPTRSIPMLSYAIHAVQYNTMQHDAPRCNTIYTHTLQYNIVRKYVLTQYNTKQYDVICRNMPQHNVLRHNPTQICRITMQYAAIPSPSRNMLQYDTRCNTTQYHVIRPNKTQYDVS